MILVSSYVLSLVFIFTAIRALYRGDIRYAPIFLISLMILASALSGQNIIYSDFAEFWSQEGARTFSNWNMIYFIFVLVGLVISHPSILYTNYKINIENPTIILGRFKFMISIGAILMLCAALVHMISIDWRAIYFSETYLFMNSIHVLENINTISVFLHVGRNFLGLIAFVLIGISIVTRNWTALIILIIPCAWFFALGFSSHSRFPVSYAGVVGSILFISRMRSVAIIFLTFALISYVSALMGRSAGAHGISQIIPSLMAAVNPGWNGLERLVTNFFEGVYNQGEVFWHLGYAHPSHYKVLSFSPLPSFIDQFSTIGLPYQMRYHPFVPMGATSEVLLFGWTYFIIYWTSVFAIYKLIMRSFNKSTGIIPILALMIFMFALYAQFTYPLRWVFRPYLLSGAIALSPIFIRGVRSVISQRGYR